MNSKGQGSKFETFMDNRGHVLRMLHSVNDSGVFEDTALTLFRWQARKNPVYQQYISLLGVDPERIDHLEAIPFLPISFFKTATVATGHWQAQTTFLSSHTTGSIPSRHLIWDVELYHTIAKHIFESFYGRLEDFHLLALLPPHIDAHTSSLMSMLQYFVQETRSPHSGFYQPNQPALHEQLDRLKADRSRRTALWGTSYALMDLAESGPHDLSSHIALETGGMKGKREELVREELHALLRERLHLRHIHSEYGMAELLSQSYALQKGIFQPPTWVDIQVRDPKDPFARCRVGETGGINVIDLANVHSCAFIETQDMGKLSEKGGFEILGRMDNSDIRGCSLLSQQAT